VPFCYGTVAWFIGKKVRVARSALLYTLLPLRLLLHKTEHAGGALAPLDRLRARRRRRGPDARHLAGTRARMRARSVPACTSARAHKRVGSCAPQQVTFTLHPSFKQAVRTLTAPPFELTETGWGEFEIGISVR
jgi:hypothetical protein